jgi:hypothetical protein
MDQLTWLQQSLQKPRLSAVARTLAEVFPRPDVPRVLIGTDDASKGIYNSAARMTDGHLEYPGFVLRYREMSSAGNHVGYGWARQYQDHIGVLGGQVTVANDGFMGGAYIYNNDWMAARQSLPDGTWKWRGYKQSGGAFDEEMLVGFASLVPVLAGLLTNDGGAALTDSDGTILLTGPLEFEEPISRGFTSIQWLTQSETQRA